jgi:hypothetical protein
MEQLLCIPNFTIPCLSTALQNPPKKLGFRPFTSTGRRGDKRKRDKDGAYHEGHSGRRAATAGGRAAGETRRQEVRRGGGAPAGDTLMGARSARWSPSAGLDRVRACGLGVPCACVVFRSHVFSWLCQSVCAWVQYRTCFPN